MTDRSESSRAPSTTVRQRIARGIGANAFGQAVTIIIQLVGVPILLHAWGTQMYGEWLLLSAIPAYLSMTDLGFSLSAANDMTARVARGERAGALAVFQSLGVLVYAVAALGMVLTAAVAPWLPLTDWLHLTAMDASTAQWVLWLLAAQVLVTLPDGVTHAGFRASGEYALHGNLNSLARLGQFGGIWLAALAGASPVISAAVALGVRAFATAFAAALLVHRHHWLRFGTAHAQSRQLAALVRPALANVAIPLAQALNLQGMVLVVGAVLGPLAVVTFSTLRTLTRLSMQLVLALAHAVEPELAAAHGAADTALMRRLFLRALGGGLWLALGAAALLAVAGGLILDLWTHGRVAMQAGLFGWLLASAVASVLWYGALIALKAANRHLRAAYVYALASAGVVAMATLLLHLTHDLATAGLALLVMDVAMTVYALSAAGALLGLRPLASLTHAANPVALLRDLREGYD